MKWVIDPVHSTIGFSAKHMMVSTVRGRFGAIGGDIELDPAAPDEAAAEITIDAASVDTGMPARDQHLRSVDFLDAEKYPEITFRTSKVHRLGGPRFRIEGDLTIRGVTRPIALDAELTDVYVDRTRGARIGISARGSIDRSDFGLRWNQALEAGGVLVSERVSLEVEIAAARAAEAVAA